MSEPEPGEITIVLLRDLFFRCQDEAQRSIIFQHVRAIRTKQALLAFEQMERDGGKPFVHFMEKRP
jgi:hypothetical protein